jgi:hypothetical protein
MNADERRWNGSLFLCLLCVFAAIAFSGCISLSNIPTGETAFGLTGTIAGYGLTVKGVVEIATPTAVPTNTPPVVTNVPPVVVDTNAPAFVSLPNSGNVKWADLKQEATITSGAFDGESLTLSWDYTTGWTGSGDQFCDKTICFFAKDRAAYLDYGGIGWTSHKWDVMKGIRDGHGDLGLKSGDRIGFFIAGWRNAAERSDIFWTVIP